jgi:uncharacterized protein YggU (UPF0235/DUF167 family)
MPTLPELMAKDGYYRVKVTTKQPETRFTKVLSDGTIKISLTAVPEKGKANAELLSFLCDELDLQSNQIRLVSGMTSPLKVIAIDRLTH